MGGRGGLAPPIPGRGNARSGLGNKGRRRARGAAPQVGGQVGVASARRESRTPPPASPFMVRRRGGGRRERRAGRRRAGGAPPLPALLARRRAGAAVGAGGAGKRAGVGVRGGVPGLCLCPGCTQVTAPAALGRSPPRPQPGPQPLRSWRGPARRGGAGVLSFCLCPSVSVPRVGGGQGWCPCPRAERQGPGWAGRKLPHKEDSVPHMDRIKVPGGAPQ